MQAVKSIQFKVSSSLSILEERIQTLYERPVKEPMAAWKASGKLYSDFQIKKGLHNVNQIATPSKDEFRTRLTPSIITHGKLSGRNPDLALLFLSYAALQADAVHRKMTSQEIVDNFGEPPWDLLNEIFEVAELPFRVEPPQEPKLSVFSNEIEYELRFFDTTKKVTLSPNDLSDGEKVIVSMVFLHYTSEYGNSKYKLLLLDEPDTHLHPSFIKKYIRILNDVLVNQKQARIIMTTHSPLTVALVPEASIYSLDLSKGNAPLKVSRENALEALLDGVPSLRVRYEQRCPIFVESKNDVIFYEGLLASLRGIADFIYEPVFLYPHSGTSNCTDVINIVNNLEKSGCESIYGIIDCDKGNTSTKLIKVLGNGKRYAIENYLLDPIIVSLALIRNNLKSFSSFGVSEKTAYIQGSSLTNSEAQLIVDTILNKLDLQDGPRTTVVLENGFEIEYPNAFLKHHGHEYEQKLISKYMELNALKRGRGDQVLKENMIPVIRDFPHLLPVDIRETLESILGKASTL